MSKSSCCCVFVAAALLLVCSRKEKLKMQDPNEDTEWNDVLRAKGIIPDKPKENEISEDDIISMMEKTIKQKSGGNDS